MIRYTAGSGIRPTPKPRPPKTSPPPPPPPDLGPVPPEGRVRAYVPPPPTETAADLASQCHQGSPPTASGATSTTAIVSPPARTSKESKRPPLPDWVSGAVLNETEPVLPEELVSGVLHKGAKMVIGGGSKTGKTWLLIDLALSVSSGTPWLGLNCRPGIVVYLNFEIQAGFFHDRLLQVADAKEIELTDSLLVWNLRGFARPAKELFEEVRERLAGRDVALVVVDPVYKLALGGDENSAGEVGLLLNEFENLATSTGAAVAFSAHFAKGDATLKSSVDRISGSGVFARDPDAILTMTGTEEKDVYHVESTLRNCRAIPAFAVRWAFPLLVPEQMKPISEKPGRKVVTDEDYIGVLPHPCIENPRKALWPAAKVSEEIGKLGFPKAGLGDMRKALAFDGKIYVEPKGDRYGTIMIGRKETGELIKLQDAKNKDVPVEGKEIVGDACNAC